MTHVLQARAVINSIREEEFGVRYAAVHAVMHAAVHAAVHALMHAAMSAAKVTMPWVAEGNVVVIKPEMFAGGIRVNTMSGLGQRTLTMRWC